MKKKAFQYQNVLDLLPLDVLPAVTYFADKAHNLHTPRFISVV
jgi:hypothetical protein